MMRRLLLIALTALASASAVGCGKGERAAESVQTPSPTETAVTAATPTPSSAAATININSGLYVIDETGQGAPLQIVDFAAGAPRWTASGDRLYFMGGTGQDPRDVYTSSATGGGLTNLLETDSDPLVTPLFHALSPDLSHVAYQTITSDGGWVIRVADLADPDSDRKLADGMLGAWSIDGAFLSYYSPACQNLSLIVTTPAGRQLPVEPYVEGSSFGWAAWLPEGTRLAYQSWVKTASGVVPNGIVVYDVATSETSESPELQGVEQQPVFSPDGNWFVYAGEAQGVYLERWGEKTPARIGDYSPWTPVWSPQSDKIALVDSDKIVVYDVVTESSHLINLHYLSALPEGMSFWRVDVSWSPRSLRWQCAQGLRGVSVISGAAIASNPRGGGGLLRGGRLGR
jgi:WD40-like Beta Propeller Repeat